MLRGDKLYSLRNSRLFRNVLNEVINGFALDNLDAVIGMNRSELKQLSTHLKGLPNDVEIELNLTQTKALRNALHETLRELGDEEFHTRTGFDFEEGEEALKHLDDLIRGTGKSVDE